MLANKKPWCWERVIYETPEIAIWLLKINPWESTSQHSHPNKKTGLIVVEGAAEVSFLSGNQRLFSGDKIQIRNGVFHQTRNPISSPLYLLEIESPNKKDDLVRIADKYNRPSYYTNEELIETNENFILSEIPTRLGSCLLSIETLTEESEQAQYGILEGGIIHENIMIAAPGDLISKDSIDKLLKSFRLMPNTKVLKIKLSP